MDLLPWGKNVGFQYTYQELCFAIAPGNLSRGQRGKWYEKEFLLFLPIFNVCFVIKNTPLITLEYDKMDSVVARANVMFDGEILVFL